MNQDQRQARLLEIRRVAESGPFHPSWDSLETKGVPDWYIDGKFGLFIHWGIYSVPAFGSEWYPRQMYLRGTREYEHHRATYGPQDEFGYKDFIPHFRAERFDPADWAELFRDAGARFVVPVAEHHDGFQLYRSALSRWNAAEMGPGRDIVGELGREVRQRGMVLGASSHRAEHWWFMGGGREFDSDVRDPRFADFYGPAREAPGDTGGWDNYLESPPDTDFLDDWLLRTCELVDLHRPALLWFDWWIMNLAFKPYLKLLAAYYYNRAAEWGIQVAINYKYDAFPTGAAVFDIERGQSAGLRGLFWQNDTAVQKNSWGYTENQDYKTASDLLGDLADIASKNGALLLNIGPRADGTIPEPERRILLEIGAWLRANGEAIYGTRPWRTFGEGPTRVAEGAFSDTNRSPFTHEDIRFTTRGDVLYALVLAEPPDGSVAIRSLGLGDLPLAYGRPIPHPRAASVTLLDGERPLSFRQDDAALHIRLPDGGPSAAGPRALRIQFAK